MILGADFDNTIVNYDSLFYKLALNAGLVDTSTCATKTSVRDYIRKLDGGEILWQQLQAEVYGVRISEAMIFPGVTDFFERCIKFKVPLYIVSHKTKYARRGNVDMREAALGFMELHNLFNNGPYGLDCERVFFADTRSEKAEMIASIGCDAFVDDLVEVFTEPLFPQDVSKYLFSARTPENYSEIKVVSSWEEFSADIFSEFNLCAISSSGGGNGR